jgi:gamma-glutamylcyclotransferase (GGCT)/AIG2-like uncharacterized protein YtfP
MNLFVYGTLKIGFRNNKILKDNDLEYVGDGTMYSYSLYDLPEYGFPIAKFDYGQTNGEIFSFEDRKVLDILDKLEMVDSEFYQRVVKPIVQKITGKEIYCYTYIADKEGDKEIKRQGKLIATGDYV